MSSREPRATPTAQFSHRAHHARWCFENVARFNEYPLSAINKDGSFSMTTKKGLKIASLAGIPIYVSWSWWFFAALIMVVFRPTFSQALPDSSTSWTWAVATFFVLIMFGTVLFHALAYALAAISFRWKVKEFTLNFWGGATN